MTTPGIKRANACGAFEGDRLGVLGCRPVTDAPVWGGSLRLIAATGSFVATSFYTGVRMLEIP